MTEQTLTCIADIGDDFIGVFDNACPPKLCDDLKDYFDIYHSKGFTYGRSVTNKETDRLKIDDLSLSMTGLNLVEEVALRTVGQLFNPYFWNNCYVPYASKYTILNSIEPHKIIDYKLQRTLPGEGYHIWHCETNQPISF